MHFNNIDVVAVVITHSWLVISPFPHTINNEPELQTQAGMRHYCSSNNEGPFGV